MSEIFGTSADSNEEETLAPEGHPIRILMEEHKMLLTYAAELNDAINAIKKGDRALILDTHMGKINHCIEGFKDSENHYLREENVIFPFLQKHGVTQPPRVMWMEHDTIRETKKSLYGILDRYEQLQVDNFLNQIGDTASALYELLSSHFFKENNILFPTALQMLSEDEWVDAGRQFDEIGYCCFTPKHAKQAAGKTEKAGEIREDVKGKLAFETGMLSGEQIEAVLNTLPVEITFVDKDEFLRYFNQKKDMIFRRTKASLGLKVQECHPQKSVHLVNKILDDFKKGTREVADFRITMGDKFVYIRYFPVRNKGGEYIGCMEVTQDIAEIKKLEGQKRLLE